MATTDEQNASGGPIGVVTIGGLEVGTVVRMEDAEYEYHLAVAERIGAQVLAEAWRRDLANPTTPDGRPDWRKYDGLVGLPGSCISVDDRAGRTSFEAQTVHRIPKEQVPGKLVVKLCAYLQWESGPDGAYIAYVTGPLKNLRVFRQQASDQAS